jgi:hypothetical protein
VPDEGSPFACNLEGGDPDGCRFDFKGKEGESEDEYWERHPEDVVEVEDFDALVVGGAEETLGQKKAYVEKFKALSSDETTTAKLFAETILGLATGRSNTSQGLTINRVLKTGNALKNDEGQPLYVGNKMTSSSFGKTKNGEKELRAALEGIWTRCESGQRITLVTATIKPVEDAVKKAEGDVDKVERAAAAGNGSNNLALLAHAWVDPDLANLRLEASKRVDGQERIGGLQAGMTEYAALKYKDFIEEAMAKKQSYRNEFSTALHGNDCFEATQHIDPNKADLKTPADVDVCKWVKSHLTTLANRHGQLKNKVEASGWSKTTGEVETWERAYDKSKTGNAADPVALYVYLVWDGKDIGTFSAVLDDVLSHGHDSVQPGAGGGGPRNRSGTGTGSGSDSRAVSLAQAITSLQPSNGVREAQQSALRAQAQRDAAQAAATSATTTIAILKDSDAISVLVDVDAGETAEELREKLRKKARRDLDLLGP